MTQSAMLAGVLIAVSFALLAAGYAVVRRGLRPLKTELMAYRCGACLYPVTPPWSKDGSWPCSECGRELWAETLLSPGSGPEQRPRPAVVGVIAGVLIALGICGLLGGVQVLILRSDSWERSGGAMRFGPRVSASPRAVQVLLNAAQWRSGGTPEGVLEFEVAAEGETDVGFVIDLATRHVTRSSVPGIEVGTVVTPETFGSLFDERLGEAGSPFRATQRQSIEAMFGTAMVTPRSFAAINWESSPIWERREGGISLRFATLAMWRLGPVAMPTDTLLAGNMVLLAVVTAAAAGIVARRVRRASEADVRAFETARG